MRKQTGTVSGECVPPDFSRNSGVLTGSRLRPGALGVCAGWLTAGGPPARASGGTRGRCPRDSRLRLGALGARVGRLVAGGVRETKDRDMPALEVRAGMSGVGHTARDVAGLSSTNKQLKWPEHQWRMGCNPSVLKQRLRFSHCCSDSQKRHSRLPGKAAREQKPGNTGSQCARPHPPSQGTRRLYPKRVA